MAFWQLYCGFSEFLPYIFSFLTFLQRSKSSTFSYWGTYIGSKSYPDHPSLKNQRQRKGCYTGGRWRNASPFCLFCMAAFSWATHPKQYLLSVKIFTTITVFFTLHKNKIIGAFSENIKLSTMLKCNMGNNLLFSDKQKIYLHSADW